jgi:hypothetical protein
MIKHTSSSYSIRSDVFNHVLYSSKYMFLEFLSHYNTTVSHMIKHTSLRFLYGTFYLVCIQLCYYVFIFLHLVKMFFQYIPNEVSYVYKISL